MTSKLLFLSALVLMLLVYGFRQAIFMAPTDLAMGNIQRIFYYHVPSAFVAFTCFFANLIASLWYLKSRRLSVDAWALATAEVGVIFCTVVLITGPLWARPVWGIWWTWDARLTSTLLLWLIYVSYLLLRRYSSSGQTPLLAAVPAIFGFLDVPFVYLANRLFPRQHPQPVYFGGGGADPRMTPALLLDMVALACFTLVVCWVRYNLARGRQVL